MVRKERNTDAPNWSDATVKAAADRFVKMYVSVVGEDHLLKYGMGFNDVFDLLIKPKFGIHLIEGIDLGEIDGRKIFGTYNYQHNIAAIDATMAIERRDPRRPFTLWHEVAGHGVLQGEWLRERRRSGQVVVTESSLSRAAVTKLERQANLFAVRVAAPSWLLRAMAHKILGISSPLRWKGPCQYWLSPNGLSQCRSVGSVYDLAAFIAGKLNGYFSYLSKEALGYRVLESGIIEGANWMHRNHDDPYSTEWAQVIAGVRGSVSGRNFR